MSNTKFSKGPWEVVRIPDSFTDTRGLYSIETNDSPWWLALVGAPAESGDIAEANAQLIASAPEMYEALSEILTLVALIDAPLDQNILKIITLCERATAKAQGVEDKA